ncbi:hypothetical protein KSP40_PGU007126 [Platanthera guangdongensis]|uniref:BRCT domain-containing protein n=1 Tax=Platanthera guangdongensis TaxID=2320717 RepID=A0ABR2LT32_9ASPA
MEDNVTEKNSQQIEDTTKFDFRVAQDSEEDNDLYLSSCIICLVGFEEKVLRKLVSMIRRGGGTRLILLSEKLTHIILGSPSDVEKKDVRRLASCGVINVVNATWLEESDQAKRELPVSSRHHSCAFMIPKGSTSSCMDTSVAVHGVKKVDSILVASYVTNSHVMGDKMSTSKLLSDEKRKINGSCTTFNELKDGVTRCEHSHEQSTVGSKQKDERKLRSALYFLNGKATFKGKTFCFSSSFPIEPRAEVIEWVNGGGGIMLDDQAKNANFIVECHGLPQVLPSSTSQSTAVSTHWIRSSLEVGCMQDVSSHILYSPLHCHIPLPGFEGLRFCVSQYEEKERTLLKNLCFVLGSKFTEKLTNKVTHLLCKFTNGPKYEAARRKGIQTITAEWITECISHDKLVPPNSFQPRPVTLQDKVAGLCTVSQHPTQAVDMISSLSQSQSQTHGLMQNSRMNFVSNRSQRSEDSSPDRKRSKLSEYDGIIDASKRNEELEVHEEDHKTVSDVIDAIDDLLAQSDKSKIQDLKSPGMPESERSIFVADHPNISQRHVNSHTAYGILSHLSIQPEKQDSTSHTPNRTRSSAPYDAFSETQTESQVVGYEEDLSGRQKIIERVRSQSLTLTPDIK